MFRPHNFARGTVSLGYDAAATTIVLTAGHGARFGLGLFAAVWWDRTTYPDPADDPLREIVYGFISATDTVTLVVRGAETGYGGLAASTKNTAAKVYGFAAVATVALSGRSSREVFVYQAPTTLEPSGPGVVWPHGYGRIGTLWGIARSDSTFDSRFVGKAGAMYMENTSATLACLIGSDPFNWGAPFFATTGQATFMSVDIMLSHISDATDNYSFAARFVNGWGGDGGADKIGFGIRYRHTVNGGKFECYNRGSSAETTADSGVTVAADTWYRLEMIQFYGAGTVFMINGAVVAFITANLLTNADRNQNVGPWLGIFKRDAGTAARRFYWCDLQTGLLK